VGRGTVLRPPAETQSYIPIWPRISPFAFFFVCTFTYRPPAFSVLFCAAVSFAVPLRGDLHEADAAVGHSATRTLPATPFLPAWMWAASAAPLRCEYVSVHESLLPVSVALNAPVAPAGAPAGFGTSWAALSFAAYLVAAGDPLAI